MSLEVVLNEPLGLPIGFPLVPFLNGILYRLVYNRKKAYLFLRLYVKPIIAVAVRFFEEEELIGRKFSL